MKTEIENWKTNFKNYMNEIINDDDVTNGELNHAVENELWIYYKNPKDAVNQVIQFWKDLKSWKTIFPKKTKFIKISCDAILHKI